MKHTENETTPVVRPSLTRPSISAILCGSASALALGAYMTPAFAQTASTRDAATTTDAKKPIKKAAAAEKPAADSGEIIVTAIRKSLKNAQNIKKSSDVIVDSITAEDIGALPDRSVAEAISRIPGVSINRFAATNDPDHFSAEGSGVTIRGLNYTRSELNGRDSFSATTGRGLSFQDVPAELMAGVDVYKNPSSDMIEGGIGGTVNLRTWVPFDAKGQKIAFSVEDSYGDFAKKTTPNYTLLYSNRWHTDIGDVGVLFDIVDSKLATRSDTIAISNYSCRTNLVTETPNGSGGVTTTPISSSAAQCPNPNGGSTPVPGIYFPRGASFTSQIADRQRQGLALATQWKSNDDTMLATVQYLRSDATQNWTEHHVEIATDNVTSNGDSWPVYGSDVTMNGQGVFTSGVLTSNSTGWAADQFGADPRTPPYGLQSNDTVREHWQDDRTEDLSVNFKWTPNAKWAFKFDFQHVDARSNIVDNTLWGSTFQDVSIKTNGDSLPNVTFLPVTQVNYATGAANCGGATGYYAGGCSNYAVNSPSSLADSFWRAAMDHYEHNTGLENTLRLDGEYTFDDNDWLKALDFGARWSNRKSVTEQTAYNWGVLSETWGGGGPIWMNQQITGTNNTSAPYVSNYTFANFMGGKIASPLGAAGLPFYNGNLLDIASYNAFATSIVKTWAAQGGEVQSSCANPGQAWTPAAQRCGVIPGTDFEPYEINPVREDNTAAYAELKYKHVLDNGYKISGNFGLRYIQTERSTQGYNSFPTENLSQSTCAAAAAQAAAQGQPYTPTILCSLTPAQAAAAQAFQNNAAYAYNTGLGYRDILPSFNLKFEPTAQLVFRLGLSQTLTAPDMGLVRSYTQYSIDTSSAEATAYYNSNHTVEATTSAGNPMLKPTISDNLDLSAEWYFAQVGSITVAAFEKALHGVITASTVRENVTNNDATFSAIATTPINSSEVGHIKGLEFSYQQSFTFLPWIFSGLGTNANYTYIDSSGVKQNNLSADDPEVSAGNVSTIDTSKLPLQGLSKNNVNVELFYEKFGVSARLAYNWRDEFLLTPRDVIVPFQPIMDKPGGTLDGSIFYSLTPNVKIGLQAVNLLNTINETKAVIGINTNGSLVEAGRSWFVEDRRFTVALRAQF